MIYYAAKRREGTKVTGREVMKKIVEDNKWTVAEFARRCGTTSPTMWDRLNSTKVKDIPLSMLNDMLRVAGYKILVVPSTAKVPNGGYYVDCISSDPEHDQKIAAKYKNGD